MNIEKDFKKIVTENRPKKCLGADFLPLIKCDKLINAHSIQNNGVLDFIAKGSQTILHRRIESDKNRQSELIYFEKIGRNAATTFGNGMCGNHDKALFECIEDQDLDIKNKKQLITFAIRSLLKETYTKEHITGISNTVFNGNNMNPLFIGYKQANKVLIGTQKSLRKIYVHEKRKYKDFKSKVFIFNAAYKIACSSLVSIWFGFNGEKISSQGLNYKKQPLLYVNIFPSKGKTYILLSFLKEDESSFREFFKYLKSLDTNSLECALSAVIICYCQNMVISDAILEDKDLVEKINKITNETNLEFTFQPRDITVPNYLREIADRDVNIFSGLIKND